MLSKGSGERYFVNVSTLASKGHLGRKVEEAIASEGHRGRKADDIFSFGQVWQTLENF